VGLLRRGGLHHQPGAVRLLRAPRRPLPAAEAPAAPHPERGRHRARVAPPAAQDARAPQAEADCALGHLNFCCCNVPFVSVHSDHSKYT